MEINSGKLKRYTLNLIINQEKIPLIKGPLERIDNLTSKVKNKAELLLVFEKLLSEQVQIKDYDFDIEYTYQHENQKDEVIFYNECLELDATVLKGIALQNANNQQFAFNYVNRYKDSSFFQKYIDAVRYKDNYWYDYQNFLNVIFGSYKSTRDSYLFMLKANKLQPKPEINKEPNGIEDSYNQLLTSLSKGDINFNRTLAIQHLYLASIKKLATDEKQKPKRIYYEPGMTLEKIIEIFAIEEEAIIDKLLSFDIIIDLDSELSFNAANLIIGYIDDNVELLPFEKVVEDRKETAYDQLTLEDSFNNIKKL